MKNRKYLWLIIFSGFFIALLIFYKTYNKPHRDIQKEEAIDEVSATQLYQAFELNENAANEKYLDNVVLVHGKLKSYINNQDGNSVVQLSVEEALMGGVSCTLSDKVDLSIYEPMDEIVLKCRCTGMLMDVVLIDCKIIPPS